ncbi:hypothetical protein RJT34_02802 [Clitoria ternatea]|uniref:RING-type E3 ubiquitin transferase n=1 Tax=Clitoria ternatea TaxID=43366 RepID=A0AAN9KJ26_CLITE
MAPSTIIISCVLLFLHLEITRAKEVNCNSLTCGDIEIRFPFGLKGSNEDGRCSYYPSPSFQLACNNRSQAILSLPKLGDMLVTNIDYKSQSIKVKDPDNCLPKRFLKKWNLSGSPFKLNPTIYRTTPYNLTFLRCSNVTDTSQLPLLPVVSCLSNYSNSSVVIVSWARPIMPSSSTCEVISWALVPLPLFNFNMPYDLADALELVWTEPRCGHCALSAQLCGFSNHKKQTLQLACFPTPSTSKGISRSAKYGLAIGVGIPGLLCLIGLSCFMCGKVRMLRHRQERREPPVLTISLEPMPFVMGLDGATIEKYPKTLIGESGRLLKPNDNTCAICLSEYEPKETLRSIPECNHYFHAVCIDEWLKMNGTCPICRNSPEASSTLSFLSFSSSQ